MPTVTRVLPWRRHSQPPAMEVQEIIEQYRRFHPKRPTDAITEAYRIAAGSHKGQLRRSGEPYITHPLAVAGIVARYGMDDVTICAALLHDAVEDTVLTLDEVEERLRRRGARDRRRRHQAGADPLRLQGGPAGRHHAQDAGGDGQGPPGAGHQAGRTACTTCGPWPRCRPGSRSAPPRRPWTSTPRWPTDSACRRSSSSSRTCASPRCTPSATPRSTTWWRTGPRSATPTCRTCWTRCGAAWPTSTSPPT